MAVVGEDMLQPTSDSFWEVEGYRRTVKRVEDGSLQCSELMKMIQVRIVSILSHSDKLLKRLTTLLL